MSGLGSVLHQMPFELMVYNSYDKVMDTASPFHLTASDDLYSSFHLPASEDSFF